MKAVEELINIYYDLVNEKKSFEGNMEEVFRLDDFSSELFTEELTRIEILIVKMLGGNDKHHAHISEAGLLGMFYEYTNNTISKSDLIDYIEKAIENNWTESPEIRVIKAIDI